MQQCSIHIEGTKLAKILQTTFKQLPKDYLVAYESFSKTRSKSFFRESLISKWIAVPTSNKVIFKNWTETFRLRNILLKTSNNTEIEIQIYLNRNGIIGVNIGEDLELIEDDKADASQFIIEKVPTSKFLTDQADLEYLNDFIEIDDYLDNKHSSEVFTIDNVMYYSIMTLSDKNCFAIDDKKSVYLLNKETGLTKLIFKNPDDFIRAFKDKKLYWINEM